MFIEVFHKGTFVNRYFIEIPKINIGIKNEQLSFKERFEAKEKTVQLLIEDFKANKLPSHYRNSPHIQLALVFESTMGEIPVEKKRFKDIPAQKLPEKEAVTFIRPKGVYSNKPLPEGIEPKEAVNKIGARVPMYPRFTSGIRNKPFGVKQA